MAETCGRILAEAARRSSVCLADEGKARIAEFVRAQQHPDGGFRGRSGASDLYYTHFAVQALLALGEPLPVPALADYLQGFDPDGAMPFVEVACLASVSSAIHPDRRDDKSLARLARFRTPEGGFNEKMGAREASAYGCFLALLAYEAQKAPLPEPEGFIRSAQGMAPSVTTAVAAKVMLLAGLGAAPDPSDADTILGRASKRGGFRAAALAPIPDLLSTATALCALSVLGAPFDSLREPCLEFVDGLWHDNGGFRGHWADRTADCEYTYYALLALGVLA